MNAKVLWISILAVLVSFFGGFYVANVLNRNEFDTLRAENSRLKTAETPPAQNRQEAKLSDEEIRARIAEADRDPNNFETQKNLGIALYQYAASEKNTKLLAEAARLLDRAHAQNAADRDVTVTLGHLHYDIGFFDKKNEGFAKAREYYQKVLVKNPDDVDIRVDFALTYFLQNPPDYDKAAAEFQKSLQTNPKHEKTLLFLIQTLLKQNKSPEAETYLAKLKEANPNAPTLEQIRQQMQQDENNPPQ